MTFKELQKEQFEEYNELSSELVLKLEELENLKNEIDSLRHERAQILQKCVDDYLETPDEERDPQETEDRYPNDTDYVELLLPLLENDGNDVNHFDSISDFFDAYENTDLRYAIKVELSDYCPHDIEYIDYRFCRDEIECEIEAEGHSYDAVIEIEDGKIKHTVY